jgi:hypothetical protein
MRASEPRRLVHVSLLTSGRLGSLRLVVRPIHQPIKNPMSDEPSIHQKFQQLQTEHTKLKNTHVALLSEHQKVISENTRLKAENDAAVGRAAQLEIQTHAILKFFFDCPNNISGSDVARQFRLKPSMADFHIDILLERQFIAQTTAGADPEFQITGLGREAFVRGGTA